jgi:thymidine phosphorylase
MQGTVDKLESIPGFKCSLPVDQIQKAVIEHGCVMTCQTPQIAPADGVLYKTRDVTETVPSVPLITASILSKKLSAGLKALVMDVKFGRAAFMQTLERARELAKSIVSSYIKLFLVDVLQNYQIQVNISKFSSLHVLS